MCGMRIIRLCWRILTCFLRIRLWCIRVIGCRRLSRRLPHLASSVVDRGSVRFASLVDDEHGFTPSFMDSFLPTLASDLGGENRIWRGGYCFQRCTSAGVVEGRNEVVKNFLDGDAEWLWFVDADMGWDHDALERLIAVADKDERPIVGGLCFGFGPISDRLDHAQAVIKKPFPTIFDLAETDDDAAFRPRWWYTPGTVVKCSATGAAMLLIHRTVLEQIADKWGAVWFDRMRHPKAKKLWGEDTSFCARAGLLGFPVFVHTGVRTSHAKTIYVTETTFMGDIVAPPATERVSVVVPVRGRPGHAAPFMQSLRASTGLADVYAVCSDHDDAIAWTKAGAYVVHTERVGFAEKLNDAYSHTTAKWIFLTGDDVRFYPGWLDHAQQVARNTGAKVVGTNDLANPRVLAGDHAVHMLIARDYIDEVGASWDGPGVVCHEYRHWYVDDEIVTAAKQRGVWAPALASVVEHLHPLWGKAEVDDTYVRGQRYAGRDKATFEKRYRESLKTVSA
jgi:GT2 family glycosyltransferase